MNKLSTTMAAAVLAVPFFTGSAGAQSGAALTVQEDAALNLVRAFNICMQNGMPVFQQQMEAYQKELDAAQEAYDRAVGAYRDELQAFYKVARIIAERDGLQEMLDKAGQRSRESGWNTDGMYEVQSQAIWDILEQKVLEETGIRKPEELQYPTDRVSLPKPEDPFRSCSATLEQGAEAAKLSAGWGLRDYLDEARKKLGAAEYLARTAP